MEPIMPWPDGTPGHEGDTYHILRPDRRWVYRGGKWEEYHLIGLAETEAEFERIYGSREEPGT